jgi:hypothetical protein
MVAAAEEVCCWGCFRPEAAVVLSARLRGKWLCNWACRCRASLSPDQGSVSLNPLLLPPQELLVARE